MDMPDQSLVVAQGRQGVTIPTRMARCVILTSSACFFEKAASYCCVKLRRNAPLENIIGFWPCCSEGKMHKDSSGVQRARRVLE